MREREDQTGGTDPGGKGRYEFEEHVR